MHFRTTSTRGTRKLARSFFVQVKSSADQQVLDDYVQRFQQRRERYARMIFAAGM